MTYLGLSPREQHAAVAALLALAAAAAAAALALSVAFDPSEVAAGAHARWLGLALPPCPGCGYCGMSRAFAAMSHLDFTVAVAYNPFVLLHYPLALLLAFGGPWLAGDQLRRARRA